MDNLTPAKIRHIGVDTKSYSVELKIGGVTWGGSMMAQGGGGTAEGTNSMCQDWSEEEGAAVGHSQLTP